MWLSSWSSEKEDISLETEAFREEMCEEADSRFATSRFSVGTVNARGLEY